MAKHPEQEAAIVSPDSPKSSDGKDTGDSTPPSKVGAKLKLIANYAMRGFAPVVAILALIIAVLAFTGNKSSQVQLSNVVVKIDSINASLSASKGELEKLKAAMAQVKIMQEDERKQQDEKNNHQDEQALKIIQNVSKMQVKMRISPTLEDQLRQPVIASAVGAVPATVAPAAAPVAKAAVPTGNDKKYSPQVQAIKDAIDKLNK